MDTQGESLGLQSFPSKVQRKLQTTENLNLGPFLISVLSRSLSDFDSDSCSGGSKEFVNHPCSLSQDPGTPQGLLIGGTCLELPAYLMIILADDQS